MNMEQLQNSYKEVIQNKIKEYDLTHSGFFLGAYQIIGGGLYYFRILDSVTVPDAYEELQGSNSYEDVYLAYIGYMGCNIPEVTLDSWLEDFFDHVMYR